MISRVKGTHDFLDMRFITFIEKMIHAHAQTYAFKHIATPILEHTELFKRSLGLQTDVVSKEMFIIEDQDHSGALCLRPEATAPTMRAFLENREAASPTPWKVYSVGPMFRHERPQKGRYRQFSQATFEIIDSASIYQDILLITMFERFFQEQCKLENYALVINFLGCSEDRKKFKEILYSYLNTVQEQLCVNCQVRKEHNIMRVFDCKNSTCKALYTKAPHLVDSLCEECMSEWSLLQQQLHVLSVSYTYNPLLVRGLDYYDKTVFEFVSDNLGAQTAFCGGGRYNRLASELGSKEDFACIGASIGIDRLIMLLEPIKNQLNMPPEPALHIILPLSFAQQSLALLLADELHAQGLCVDVYLEGDSLKNMMKKANKAGATTVLMIGPDEQQAQQVRIKKMATGQEDVVAQHAVMDALI